MMGKAAKRESEGNILEDGRYCVTGEAASGRLSNFKPRYITIKYAEIAQPSPRSDLYFTVLKSRHKYSSH